MLSGMAHAPETISPSSLNRTSHAHVLAQLSDLGFRFAGETEAFELVEVELGGAAYLVRATDEVCACTTSTLACVLCGAEEA